MCRKSYNLGESANNKQFQFNNCHSTIANFITILLYFIPIHELEKILKLLVRFQENEFFYIALFIFEKETSTILNASVFSTAVNSTSGALLKFLPRLK